MKTGPITLDQRLDMLDRNALLSLIRTLLKEEPGLAPRLDALLASAIPHGTSPKPRPTAVNPAQFRWETMATAMESPPDRVIRRSHQEAEEIMNAGRANAYETATAWLHLTRKAMVDTARQQEWNTLLTTLLQTHHRKYKLRPLLEALNAPKSVIGKGENQS